MGITFFYMLYYVCCQDEKQRAVSLWIASGDSETYQLSKFSLLDLQEKSVVSQTTVNSEMFAGILYFPNSIKRHICNVKNSQLGDDIPISVNNRVIVPFSEGFNFWKLRICEVLRK